MNRQRLPRRDWVLLPLLGLVTILAMAISTESVARRLLSGDVGSLPGCEVRNDNPSGARMTPNSVCWEKLGEGKLSEFRFNSCGDRAGMECGPKPRGVYRIVMIGTSVAVGRYLARDKTFGALLPIGLSMHTGRKIELYNKSMMQGYLDSVSLRFNELLAVQPDLILWVVTPMDLRVPSYRAEANEQPVLPASAGKPLSLQRAWYLFKNSSGSNSVSEILRRHFDRTLSALLLRHTLYQSESLYLRTYLMGSDDEAGFLKSQWSVEWKERLERFDKDVGENMQQASVAHLPLVVVFIPNRAQAAMISTGEWPVSYDPYCTNRQLRAIVSSHGGTYLDILPGFSLIPNSENHFFPVDGHPDDEGNAIIADLLIRNLTGGAIPSLKLPAHLEVALGMGR